MGMDEAVCVHRNPKMCGNPLKLLLLCHFCPRRLIVGTKLLFLLNMKIMCEIVGIRWEEIKSKYS